MKPTWPTVRAFAATALAAGLPLVGVVAIGRFGGELAAWFEALSRWEAAAVLIVSGGLLCAAALLPTHAVSLASGYVLGGWFGTMAAWTAVVAGAAAAWLVGRAVAGTGAADRWRQSERWGATYDALLTRSPWRTVGLIALIRLSPVAPYAATNVALAAVGVRLTPFIAGAAIGLLPRVAAVAWLGAGMATLDWQSPRTPAMVIIGGVATVVALAVMGRVASTAIRRAVPSPTT